MVDFSALADLIGAVITDEGLGASVTYTSTTPGTYNPATGAATPTTSTETVLAVIEDVKGYELAQGLVQIGDKRVTIAAELLSVQPKPTDTVTIGGVAYAVVRGGTIEAGGVAIIHELVCRRA